MLLKTKSGKPSFKSEYPPDIHKLNIETYIRKHHKNLKKLEVLIPFCYQLLFNLFQRRYRSFKQRESLYLQKGSIGFYKKSELYHKKIEANIAGIAKYRIAINALNILKELGFVYEVTGYKKIHKDAKSGKWTPNERKYKDKKTKKLKKYEDTKITKLYLNTDFDGWKLKELGISWWEIAQIFFLNKESKTKGTIFREKIVDENGRKVIDKKTNRQLQIETTVNPSNEEAFFMPYDPYFELNNINNYLLETNHPELIYTRIFGKDKTKGGRFSSGFHSIPKGIREKLYQEKGWHEIDFSAFNPQLLYRISTGKFYKGDLYQKLLDKCHLPTEYRSIAKIILLIVIGTSSREKAKKAIQSQFARELGMYLKDKKLGIKKIDPINSFDIMPYYKFCFRRYLSLNQLPVTTPHYLINPDYILDMVEKVYKPIKQYFYANVHTLTQNIESKIIMEVMLEMTRKDITPISIHDCVIVPNDQDSISYFETFMYEEFKRQAKLYRQSINPIKGTGKSRQKRNSKKNKSKDFQHSLF